MKKKFNLKIFAKKLIEPDIVLSKNPDLEDDEIDLKEDLLSHEEFNWVWKSNVEVEVLDGGIGAYEYWGAPGYHSANEYKIDGDFYVDITDFHNEAYKSFLEELPDEIEGEHNISEPYADIRVTAVKGGIYEQDNKVYLRYYFV